MKTRKYKYLACDFETTVYKGQTETQVWASACVELFTEDVKIFHSIDEQFEYFISLNANIIAYYHNLKFDGSFWLSYLIADLKYSQAIEKTGDSINDIKFIRPKDMENNTFSYAISDMGLWYRIIIKTHNKIIELRDSLKLLPFSVKKIGNSFGTKHKKLDMEYTGFRFPGCEITPEEQEYIKNDVLVIKEALEIMFTQGHKKLTIGSCCLTEYKALMGYKKYTEYFPNIYEINIDEKIYDAPTAGDYVRKAYRGGWCYLAKGKENRIFENGTTADVNSLYPSMMSGESLNPYPIGKPIFWKGNYIPDEAMKCEKYFFIRVKTRFYLKKGKLPFIQIKNTLLYLGNEMLETSDMYDIKTHKYYDYYTRNGEIVPATVTMTMTETDFKLLTEHYNLVDFEILDGCYFSCGVGIFDSYIEKYKKIKLENTGAIKETAKLFLNNLYGKMASSRASNFKVAFLKPDGVIGFYTVIANDKEPGYIPVGAAITSYARNFTIRAAQANYHGVDKPGFIYADTDSIHCDLAPEDIKGITVHDKNFCCWKLESCWDVGYFSRQKTYIEHIVKENLKDVEKPYYSIKCAGMPDKCKNLFIESMTQDYDISEIEDEEIKEFLKKQRTLEDFKTGLKVPGKLQAKRIKGGTLLVESEYTMK